MLQFLLRQEWLFRCGMGMGGIMVTFIIHLIHLFEPLLCARLYAIWWRHSRERCDIVLILVICTKRNEEDIKQLIIQNLVTIVVSIIKEKNSLVTGRPFVSYSLLLQPLLSIICTYLLLLWEILFKLLVLNQLQNVSCKWLSMTLQTFQRVQSTRFWNTTNMFCPNLTYEIRPG